MIKKRTHSKRILFTRKVVLVYLFLSIVFFFPVYNKFNLVTGATKTEAYDAITLAFIKIEEASREGINVTQQITKINSAIQDYNDGLYTEAYDKAHEITEEMIGLIASHKSGRLFPYILIPFNIVLVAAIIVFFGRNIRDWYRKRRNEEFKDLEIVYIEEE
ncbi:MAG: hypothetical protein KGD59_00765 [Candidatus Heimdallarchaeota archaeon]|nr:hypothetical protein [Candidatus Heimdallarchaeota archaeon]MBY8993049.1 hypothetical protein [Candidatus Heimdallarchaeota archaeon]